MSFTHLIASDGQGLARGAGHEQFLHTEASPWWRRRRSSRLAIDKKLPDGSRQLLVPNIKNCEDLDFAQFWSAYEALVVKARSNTLTVADFAGTTATLTNPGGIGTNHSVPRLMAGQGMILGVGSIDYPPEFQGASVSRINQLGVSKVTTLTSTYDHRVIKSPIG